MVAEARDSVRSADLGTCGPRAVPDHSAQGHPDLHKEAPSTEHRGGCGPGRTLAEGIWSNEEWGEKKDSSCVQ